MEFSKYKSRGVGYHWVQISKSIRKRNNYVVARYELILNLIENETKGNKTLLFREYFSQMLGRHAQL